MPTSTPTPIATDHTLVTEMGADFKYSLFAVRTDGTSKQLLDQGAHDNHYGTIVNGRVFFERHEKPFPNSPSSDRDIYSINLDGTDRRQLTSGTDDDHIAAIVGERIVVERIPPTAPNNYSTDLVSMRLDGSDLRILANNAQRKEVVATASTDGQRLLINSADNKENNLYSLHADGSSAPIAIADSLANELLLGLVGNTILFEEDKSTTGTFGDQVVQVNARNIDGSGSVVLSEGANDRHYYVGTIGDRAVIWSKNAHRVETVKLDGSDRRTLIVDIFTKPFLQGTVLYFERVDSLNVQQVFGFDVLVALQGSKKPPVQLTHASTKSRILNFAPAELKTIIVYRQNDPSQPSTASIYAVQYGQGGIQEKLLAANAGTVYSSFVHQRRFIFQRLFGPYQSVKLDGTGLVTLLNQSEPFYMEHVGVSNNGRLIVTKYTQAPAGSPLPELGQIFAVNADGGNAVPLTALSLDAAWVGF
jgi:hypothetical protein